MIAILSILVTLYVSWVLFCLAATVIVCVVGGILNLVLKILAEIVLFFV